jgi:hypothetical protein
VAHFESAPKWPILKCPSTLEYSAEIDPIAREYIQILRLPEKSVIDAFHLAMGAWHGVDYLISWNCNHIANASVKVLIEVINDRIGINTPQICTPEELMEVWQ